MSINHMKIGQTDEPAPANAELREAIWQAIKGWDLERSRGEGYAGATGTDVQTILDAVEPVFQTREQEMLDELLGELPKTSGTHLKACYKGVNTCYCGKTAIDQVVSVIERLREVL